MNYLKVISIISVMSVQLLGKEFELHTESLENLKESIVKEINRDMIDSSSISFKSAKNSRDEINSLFESESSRYRNMLLKYSIDLSYLQKLKNEKKRDSEEASVLLKNKRAKKVQIESEIANEREYLQNLKKLLKSGIEFSSNISTEGYFVTIVEGKRSVKRDQLIEMATDSINREAIGTLNGILVETVSKFSKTLSMEIKETSSGKAISDSSNTTEKIFFTDKSRNSVLIYGTKVDVYPFESGDEVLRHNSKSDKFQRYVSIVKNSKDINIVEKEILKRYPRLKVDGNFRKKIELALKKIEKHNINSLKVLKESEQNREKAISRIEKRVKARENSIKLLEKQNSIVKGEIKDLQSELKRLVVESDKLEEEFSNLYRKVIEYRDSYTFSKAEIYDRKYSDAVRETKTIVDELIDDIDKSFMQTSQKIETLYSSSDILREIVKDVRYKKEYLYAKVIPYYVEYTDRTGALVVLKAKFKSVDSAPIDNVIKVIEKKVPNGFIKVDAGSCQIGSDSGDSDERPVHLHNIEKSFYMGKYETTFKEYMEFVEATGHREPKSYRESCKDLLCPVTGVSWSDAVAYTEWKTKKDKIRYRLPTEAEWEYVAKVGLNLEYGTLFGDLKLFAWFDENSKGTAHETGTKEPNLWGAYDMYGNVWEWCLDSYSSSYSVVGKEAKEKVVRGGAYNIKKEYLRASNRGWSHKDTLRPNIGFRVVREID